MVVLDILRRLHPDIPVLFLDTGYHFPETYEYRDRMARQWGLNLINLKPRTTVAEQESVFGKLFGTQPDQCCRMRKVEPLLGALEDYEVWFTGLRREQSPTRANLAEVETHKLPSGKELLKVSPLAFWKWNEVWSYLRVNEIDYLPLYDRGYTSIGCEPCPALPLDGDPRSGRWGGKKLECGIHTFDSAKEHA
jgi:phosphoadenosine phosphosulfate reductase